MTPPRITRHFADGPLGCVHYRQAGAGIGREVLVLLHQTADSSAIFADVMPLLATHFHVIAPDTPGFGASAPPAKAPGLDGYVGALIAMADTVGVSRAHWLGHHSGASFALEIAARHADRVDRLVLCGLPDFPPEGHAARIDALSPPERASLQEAVDWTLARIEKRMRPWASETQMRASFIDTLGAITQIRAAYEAVYACDVSARIAQLRAPTLLLLGADEGFAASQRALLPRLRRALIPADLHAIEGAGATTMLQTPSAFANAVYAFLGAPVNTLEKKAGDIP